MVLERIPPLSSVLEFGCSRGRFSQLLRLRGHSVVGVEGDIRAANEAEASGTVTIVGDIEAPETWAQIEGHFDIAVFMHVLEHLADPWEALRQVQRVLPPHSQVVALLPNVASWRVRRDLFFHGRFDYADVGILDRTHLRFFTLASAMRMFQDAGLKDVTFAPVDVEIPIERRIRVQLRMPWLAHTLTSVVTRRAPNLAISIVLISGRTPPKG